MSLTEYIERLPKIWTTIIGIIFILVLGLADYLTGKEISFSIFYLLPIAAVAWFVNQRLGIYLALLGAVIWYSSDYLAGARYSHSLIPIWNAGVRLGFFLTVVIILAKLRDTYDEERQMARIDHLTGLYNSRAFYDLAKKELDRAKRYNLSLTIAYIDLDNFKTVNDSFGHDAGDDALQSVAEVIKEKVRAMDIVARIGGDEFIILFPETGVEPAKSILARIEKPLMETIKGNDFPITFSMGAVTFLKPPSRFPR